MSVSTQDAEYDRFYWLYAAIDWNAPYYLEDSEHTPDEEMKVEVIIVPMCRKFLEGG